MTRAFVALFALTLAGCSFTTGSFPTECTTDADCEGGQVCAESFCIGNTVPPGCGETFGSTAANAIHLGAALPITPSGSTDQSEIAGLNAFKLAVDEINQRTIGGRGLALHVCDTEANSDKVKQMATWLIEDQKTVAIITSGSGQTIAASTVTIPKSTVLMSATSTSPEVSSLQPGAATRLVWRTAPSDAIQGRVIANVLKTDARFTSVTRVGVIYVNDPYGQGLKDVLLGEITSPRVISSFQYERGGDVGAAVGNLNTFGPQLTVLVGFADDAVRIIQAANAISGSRLTRASNHRWFFTDSAKDPTLISSLGTQASEIQDALGTAPAQGAGLAAVYASFRDSYQSRYQIDPSSYSFTSHSYDAVYVLGLAMAFAAKDGSGTVDGPNVATGLTKLSSGSSFRLIPTQFTPAVNELVAGRSINVDGASGKLDFDPAKGEAPSPMELWRVSGTGFVTETTLEP